MKTNEVKACVTQQLRRLQVLPEPQRRAELAELRRGVGRQPGDLPALWGALLADMPEQLQGSNGPSKAEWAVYTALTLFALHQQGEAGVSMNQPGRTLGGAVRQLAEKNGCRAGLDREQRAPAVQCAGNGGFHAGSLAPPARDDPAAAAGRDPAGLSAAGRGSVSIPVCGRCAECPFAVGPGPLCEPHGEN